MSKYIAVCPECYYRHIVLAKSVTLVCTNCENRFDWEFIADIPVNTRQPQWQPIDTAPKDGRFLVIKDGQRITNQNKPFEPIVCIAQSLGEEGWKVIDMDYTKWLPNNKSAKETWGEITHWQHLPTPPCGE